MKTRCEETMEAERGSSPRLYVSVSWAFFAHYQRCTDLLYPKYLHVKMNVFFIISKRPQENPLLFLLLCQRGGGERV